MKKQNSKICDCLGAGRVDFPILFFMHPGPGPELHCKIILDTITT